MIVELLRSVAKTWHLWCLGRYRERWERLRTMRLEYGLLAQQAHTTEVREWALGISQKADEEIEHLTAIMERHRRGALGR